MKRKERKLAADNRRAEYCDKFLSQMQEYLKEFTVRDSLIKMDRFITDLKYKNPKDITVIDFATAIFIGVVRKVIKEVSASDPENRTQS